MVWWIYFSVLFTLGMGDGGGVDIVVAEKKRRSSQAFVKPVLVSDQSLNVHASGANNILVGGEYLENGNINTLGALDGGSQTNGRYKNSPVFGGGFKEHGIIAGNWNIGGHGGIGEYGGGIGAHESVQEHGIHGNAGRQESIGVNGRRQGGNGAHKIIGHHNAIPETRNLVSQNIITDGELGGNRGQGGLGSPEVHGRFAAFENFKDHGISGGHVNSFGGHQNIGGHNTNGVHSVSRINGLIGSQVVVGGHGEIGGHVPFEGFGEKGIVGGHRVIGVHGPFEGNVGFREHGIIGGQTVIGGNGDARGQGNGGHGPFEGHGGFGEHGIVGGHRVIGGNGVTGGQGIGVNGPFEGHVGFGGHGIIGGQTVIGGTGVARGQGNNGHGLFEGHEGFGEHGIIGGHRLIGRNEISGGQRNGGHRNIVGHVSVGGSGNIGGHGGHGISGELGNILGNAYNGGPASLGVDYHDTPHYHYKYGVKAPAYPGYGGHGGFGPVDFGHRENRDGHATQGSYYVYLPDGRKQIVKYRVDDYSGYVAEVSYEGGAGHPTNQGGYGPGHGEEAFRPPHQGVYGPGHGGAASHLPQQGRAHGGAFGGVRSGDIAISSGGLDFNTARPSFVGRNWIGDKP